ncbi:uncharacterized protein LOC111312150 isoform X2 [Durio zibethinus]|uniref:Uncharacterized protein LOC111312150 isoform X2 n=1 Tax=Durio zibethinus TaxID=66656 RepID=A0A6P6ASS3_DURZI|nr:uncharacterized protein LOC111312150 isoform X2 [Durio zibethinus]XP_022767925.1 uncharacterized protein LOC111312150 isoform X2 [Durio zibethinus]
MFWFSLVLSYKPIALTSAHRPGIFPPLPPTTFKSRSSSTCRPCCCTKSDLTKQDEETPEEEETFQVLTAVKSKYNDIVIVDTPKSRMLLLDSTHNVHSVLQKGDEKWTGSYWDEFATLPPIVPEGPIAIYGLGGGTAAHLMLDVWPSLQLQGWEIDEILIDKAREYFGLSNLERCNKVGGRLEVHIDDAFSPRQHLPAGYAGIIIDLFYDGKALSQLQEVETWLELSDRLMPDGRLMVNCGGVSESSIDGKLHHQSVDDVWIQNSTIKALAKAFPGQALH